MDKKLPKPTAILFDWDNTLVNTFPIIYQGLHDAFVAMDMEPWTFEDIMSNREGIHNSLRDSFPRIFGNRWEDARKAYYDSFLANHLMKMEVLSGAAETLDLLSDKDIFVAIVSNKTGKYLRIEVEHLGWQNYFDRIVGANDAAKDKPYSDPVHLAMDGSGIKLDEKVLFIGDSTTDVECALNCGVTPIIFGDHIFGQGPNSHGVDLRKLIQVKNHEELQKLIKGFKNA